jgi:hypothetical protein
MMMVFVSSMQAGYYVSSLSSGPDAGNGTAAQPWTSLNSINRYSFSPGDTIYFERGSSWTGSFEITSSGTADQPIVYAPYGTGNKPSITNPDSTALDGNAIRVSANYIIIDGFYIHDCANQDPRRVGAICSFDSQNHHITVKNCEVYNCYVGVRMYAHDVLITNNYLHDAPGAINKFWGPMGIVCCSYNVEISYNHIENYIAPNNWGYDGGALEVDDEGPKYNYRIHHNVTKGNEGFFESIDDGECPECTYKDFAFYYNFSDDYQWWIDGPIGINPIIENNTVLRVLPANTRWNLCLSMHEEIPKASIKNNIFVLANGVTAFDQENPSSNNLYFSVDNSVSNPKGYELGPGEIIADPKFVNYNERKVRLQQTSLAIDAGINLGYKTDLDGNVIPHGTAPDMGAYEFFEK